MERLALEFVLRSSLIVLAAAIVLRVLHIRAASAQHAVWVGVLVVMLALPLWISWGPKASLAVLPVSDASPMVRIASGAALTLTTELEVPGSPMEVTARSSTWRWNWNIAWPAAYLIGAFALLLRLAIGAFRANRLTSKSCVAPVTVGLLQPRVILPECAGAWPEAQLDAVLAHENAHVRRRDPLVLWLALLNRAVFWFHPLAWWLERRISALAEEACDAAVIEHGHDPRDYSEYLLDVARAVQRAGARVNVTAMAMPGSCLTPRIKKIIAGVGGARVSRVRIAGAVFALAICSAMFAAGSLEHVARLEFPPIVPLRIPVYRVFPEAPAAQTEAVKKLARVLIAQATPTPQPDRQPSSMPTFLTNVGLVIVDATVSDQNGKSIEGLRASDFVVTEDDVIQKISVFEYQEVVNIHSVQRVVSSYYVLGYYTSNLNADGTFRKVNMSVKVAGAKLNHRMGYYARLGSVAGVAGADRGVAVDSQSPVLIRKEEPEYSEEARKAKWQGTVGLSMEVNPSGDATNVRVIHSLGLGLDEKAVEAVSRWKFKPGMKDGKPVNVQAEVDVNFRLL